MDNLETMLAKVEAMVAEWNRQHADKITVDEVLGLTATIEDVGEFWMALTNTLCKTVMEARPKMSSQSWEQLKAEAPVLADYYCRCYVKRFGSALAVKTFFDDLQWLNEVSVKRTIDLPGFLEEIERLAEMAGMNDPKTIATDTHWKRAWRAGLMPVEAWKHSTEQAEPQDITTRDESNGFK